MMEGSEKVQADGPSGPPASWYLNPSLHLVLNCILMTASELLLKKGATETALIAAPRWLEWTGIMTLGSGWVIGGIALYILAFVNWLYVLRWIPLTFAYLVTSVVYVLIPLGALFLLKEQIGALRWGGIALITGGVILCARPAAAAEDKL
jgi:drug/metabolite transporter (DMT)-like permease